MSPRGRSSKSLSTLIQVELDPRALVFQATHHANSRKPSASNRVGAYEAVVANEADIDNNEVVDVFKVLSDIFLLLILTAAADDEVASCANGEFVRDVVGKGELAVVPEDFDALLLDVEIVPTAVFEKGICVFIMDEGNRCAIVFVEKIDVKQLTTTHSSRDIRMSRAFWKVRNQDSSGSFSHEA